MDAADNITSRMVRNATGVLINTTMADEIYSYGSVVERLCTDGYYVEGVKSIACTGANEWNDELGSCESKSYEIFGVVFPFISNLSHFLEPVKQAVFSVPNLLYVFDFKSIYRYSPPLSVCAQHRCYLILSTFRICSILLVAVYHLHNILSSLEIRCYLTPIIDGLMFTDAAPIHPAFLAPELWGSLLMNLTHFYEHHTLSDMTIRSVLYEEPV